MVTDDPIANKLINIYTTSQAPKWIVTKQIILKQYILSNEDQKDLFQ